jgi:O-antigen ligase
MPPTLALVLTLLFIAYLFKRELQQEYVPSLALLLPCIYLLILGSRSVTAWVNLGSRVEVIDIAEGSPLDRTVFLVLLVAGLVVLFRRRIFWSRVFRDNIWLTLFLIYCGISITWSDFPDIGFKRWIKGIGDPIMILILLTDREPIKAIQFVLKTCIYILIPLSILFIKYYPHIGRGFSEWTGAPWNTGVTTNKNLLGFVLLVSGLFLIWRLSARWRAGDKVGNRLDEVGIPLLLLCMVGWLFLQANSMTSLLGFILGSCVLLSLGLRNIQAHIGSYLIVGALAFLLMQVSFDIYGTVLQGAGRDLTLTGRTDLWEVLLRMDPKPIFGHGFESFWLGNRLKHLHELYYFRPNQAHNGYIEVYLNLGWLGLCFLGGLLLSGYLKIKEQLASALKMNETDSFARFGMAFLTTYIVYNYTEAAFKSLHFLFIIFLMCTMKYPLRQQRLVQSSPAGVAQGTEQIRRVTGVG